VGKYKNSLAFWDFEKIIKERLRGGERKRGRNIDDGTSGL